MDMNCTCPFCGKRKFQRTRNGKGDRIKCVSHAPTFRTGLSCSWVSDVMTEEEMDRWLNYVPTPMTPLEECLEYIKGRPDEDFTEETVRELILMFFDDNSLSRDS